MSRRLAVPGAGRRQRSSRLVVGFVIALGLVGLVASCSLEEAPAAPADDAGLVLGREVYVGNCQSCHGGLGGGGRGAKLNDGWVLERFPDAAEEATVIAEGVRAMPGFGEKLTAEEIDAVVRYTREVLAVTGAE